MKGKFAAMLAALVILACLLPPSAVAVGAYSWTGEWETDWGDMTLTQTVVNVTGTYDYDDGIITGTVSGNTLTGTWAEAPSYAPPHDAGRVEFVMSADGRSFTGKWCYGDEDSWGNWDGGIRIGEPVLAEQSAWGNVSSWASAEVQKAVDNGLYPDIFNGADLTKPITRGEFAAVAVKLYETLSGTAATPAPANTFTDTRDTTVLKAYALDIVGGVGGGKYAPNELLNREQAAAMLTRVYKKLNWEGWTLAGDASYTPHSLDNKGVAPFADDANISAWAKPSVYFMVKYDIIKGLGGNRFGPKNTTSAETAAGYANATREQTLLFSNRTFETADSIIDGGPVTTQQPASSVSVTGAWRSGDRSRPTYIGRLDSNVEYIFYSDGTYSQIAIASINYIYSCTAYKGSYKISGGTITITNRTKATFGIQEYDWGQAHDMAGGAKFEPVANEVMPFTVTDSENISINGIALYRVK